MNSRFRGALSEALALFALAALVSLHYAPLWGSSRAWCGLDFDSQVLPFYHWLHQKYSAGLVPLWSDQVQAGFPFLDGSVSAYFYPPRRFLLTLFDAIPALALESGLHAFLAGAGAYAFCRLQQLSRPASLLSAMVGSMGGGIVFAQHAPWILDGLAWLPWQFVGAELALRHPSKRLAGAALLGMATAFSITGGHPSYFLFGGLMVAGYSLARLPGSGLRPGRLAKLGFTAGTVAAVLAWGHLRVSLRGMAESLRALPLGPEESFEGSLSPLSLLHLVLPYAYGDPRDGSFLGKHMQGGTWMHEGLYLYVSLAALALALYAIWRLKGVPRILSGLALFILLVALGKHLPIFGWFRLIPGFDRIRSPGKWVLLAGFPVSVMAAFGLDALLKEKRPSPAPALITAIAAAALAAAWAGFQLYGQNWISTASMAMAKKLAARPDAMELAENYGRILEQLHVRLIPHLRLQAILAALLAALFLLAWRRRLQGLSWMLWLALCVADLFANTFAYYPTTSAKVLLNDAPAAALIKDLEPDHRAQRFFAWGAQEILSTAETSGWAPGSPQRESILEEVIPGDMPLMHGLSSLRGYHTLHLFRSTLILDGLRDSTYFPALGQREKALESRRGLLDRGAARYLLHFNPLPWPGLKSLGRHGHLNIYRNEWAKPLAWAASEALPAAGPREAASLALKEPPLSKRVFVEKGRTGKADSNAKISWLQRGDEAWELKVEAKQDAYLVLSRTPYRGLIRALVDGKESPWQETDGAFSGIWVAAGTRTVRMEAKDPDLKLTFMMHLAGLVLALGLMDAGLFLRTFQIIKK